MCNVYLVMNDGQARARRGQLSSVEMNNGQASLSAQQVYNIANKDGFIKSK